MLQDICSIVSDHFIRLCVVSEALGKNEGESFHFPALNKSVQADRIPTSCHFVLLSGRIAVRWVHRSTWLLKNGFVSCVFKASEEKRFKWEVLISKSTEHPCLVYGLR